MRWTLKLLPLAATVAALGALVATNAEADQCWAVTANQADQAAKLLIEKKDVRIFCAPCKDKVAKSISVANAQHVKKAKKRGGEFDIVVVTDGAGATSELDLAYTYVRRQPGENVFVNVASVVGCPAQDVPERIDSNGAALP